MKGNFLRYKLIGNVAYPMQPWFYSPFKVEKYGLPIQNTLESSTTMPMERTFGMLKGRFRILLKKIDIPLHHMLDLVMICICL
jgi:hypothetical protein